MGVKNVPVGTLENPTFMSKGPGLVPRETSGRADPSFPSRPTIPPTPGAWTLMRWQPPVPTDDPRPSGPRYFPEMRERGCVKAARPLATRTLDKDPPRPDPLKRKCLRTPRALKGGATVMNGAALSNVSTPGVRPPLSSRTHQSPAARSDFPPLRIPKNWRTLAAYSGPCGKFRDDGAQPDMSEQGGQVPE